MNVLRVDDLTHVPSIDRELAMIKVAPTSRARSQVMQLPTCSAPAWSTLPESLIVETTGTEEKIDGLLDVLRPYGVLEMVRTGRVAMVRGSRPPRRLRDRVAGTEGSRRHGCFVFGVDREAGRLGACEPVAALPVSVLDTG